MKLKEIISTNVFKSIYEEDLTHEIKLCYIKTTSSPQDYYDIWDRSQYAIKTKFLYQQPYSNNGFIVYSRKNNEY